MQIIVTAVGILGPREARAIERAICESLPEAQVTVVSGSMARPVGPSETKGYDGRDEEYGVIIPMDYWTSD